MSDVSNNDDVIQARDVWDRIQDLEAEWTEATGNDPDDYALSEDDWAVGLGADGAAEIVALRAFYEQIPQDETLIADSYFKEYAQELAEDIAPSREVASMMNEWPYNCIDWDQAANDLKMDYTSYDFQGVTYWARA